jgi:O-antigen ligase
MLAMVVIFLAALAFSFRIGGKNTYGLIGIFGAVAAFLALEIGMVPIINRFVLEDPMRDLRWVFFDDTISAIAHFFPFGSGAGTFVHVFPKFQSMAFSGIYVNNAHNDYLEWLMEGGLIALALIIAFAVFYFKQWFKLLREKDWKTTQFIQVGAGIGVFAMMLHSFLDFNLHIPANQVYFAFLAGLFFVEIKQRRFEIQDLETTHYEINHLEAAHSEISHHDLSHSIGTSSIGLPTETLPDMPTIAETPAQPEKKLSFITKDKNPFAD